MCTHCCLGELSGDVEHFVLRYSSLAAEKKVVEDRTEWLLVDCFQDQGDRKKLVLSLEQACIL